MVTRSLGRAVLFGGLVSAVFAACAQGGNLGVGGAGGGEASTGTGSAAHGGGMPEAGPSGMIGSPCTSNADCVVGNCAPIGGGSYCTQLCPPPCPEGSYCTIVGENALCAPDLDQQCLKCTSATDCKLPTDACLTAPPGDSFCARDCTVDGLCPNGFTCMDKASYAGEALDAGAGDGGKPDGGKADAGSADAGMDAGGPIPSSPTRWCVPNDGFSCPCNDKRDGVTHECSVKNATGVCGGMETCNGKTAAWQGCTAATPAAETCNGKDDDCNGMVDDGDPNALCASAGPRPPHASWTCKDATCALGACDPGWISYPAGPASQGCPCAVDMGEPNGTCAMATDAGMVSDTGTPITITGTLSSDADVDFWSVTAVDTPEASTNSFHMSISFTAPMPNTEFMMDVIQGDPCVDAPTGPSTGIVAYDWCVNATDGAHVGEAPCSDTGAVHCNDHSGKYYIRVYRVAGATPTCTPYTLTVSAGGGACNLGVQCTTP